MFSAPDVFSAIFYCYIDLPLVYSVACHGHTMYSANACAVTEPPRARAHTIDTRRPAHVTGGGRGHGWHQLELC